MRRALKHVPLVLLSLVLVLGCGTEEDSAAWSSDPADALDPAGNASLNTLEEAMVKEALKAARTEINKARPVGIKAMVDELKSALQAKGIDTTSIASIDDKFISDPSKLDKAFGTTNYGKSTSSLVGTKSQALNKNQAQYKDCPILAPEKNEGTTCDQLVTGLLTKVQSAVTSDKTKVESAIKQTYSDLNAQAQAFVAAWALTAQNYGASVAMVYAKHELKSAAKCDTHQNGMQIAYNLGVEQGWDIVLGLRAWALSQVTSCVVNTDLIAEQVRRTAKSKVSAYMKANQTCQDADIGNLNTAYKAAEVKREEGIKKGIDQRVEILRNELFQARQNAPCPDSGGGGEPVVIDLDGDGLTLTSQRVKFDILGDDTTPLTTWAGAREGLLAIDVDGDGAITSVRELMGDKSDCGDRTCYDGIEALRALDDNGDGELTAADAAFGKLLVWVDGNQNAVSEAGELSSLADRGITAIRLSSTTINERRPEGLVAERISVVTNHGLRFAYDAWFQVALTSANLPGLAPQL